MEQIKIWFTDFWPEWKDEDFITPILEKHFEVVLDKSNPDVLFHSIFGYNSENFKCKKILYIAENIRNLYNQTIRNNINIAVNSAYATIGFDPHSETNYQLPLWQVYILLNPKLKERLLNRLHYDNFERWCAFIVSNPSNFIRNSTYNQLSEYKKIHSYGRYLTNDLSLQQASQGRYWRDTKDEYFLKHSHKFMIAYENTLYKYYCTEKLMDAFLAGSMPIYWGDTKVSEDWNEKAFINTTRFEGNLVELIKRIDNDKFLFESYYNEPVFTDEQRKKLEDNLNNFDNWLIDTINK